MILFRINSKFEGLYSGLSINVTLAELSRILIEEDGLREKMYLSLTCFAFKGLVTMVHYTSIEVR